MYVRRLQVRSKQHRDLSMTDAQRHYEDILAAEGMPSELAFEGEQMPVDASTELERAGVDAATDSCTFLEMNGRNIFVVAEGLDYEATEGVMASSC